MRVTFCGVRGSVATPFADQIRYGGNTSCVALSRPGEPPDLLLDAGTGLRAAADLLDGQPFDGTILLTHLHPDHIQGLPFFRSADGGRMRVHLPDQGDPYEVLGRAFGPPLFPLTLERLRGDWSFDVLEEGPHTFGAWSVLALDLPHGGGRTLGYRVEHGGHSLAYVTDHCPTLLGPGPDGLGDRHENALRLADGVDLLIHDAHLTGAEVPDRAYLGHAAVEYAARLAEQAGARRLALFHHDPGRTDEQVDAIVAELSTTVPFFAAAEGLTVDLADA
ncbi:MAG TPA: MBL fold metallo-hydrolase [Mycobacteriales bacterium]|nr:MBL fold metallo-hydrolase [Mycobacteriales bacterium]